MSAKPSYGGKRNRTSKKSASRGGKGKGKGKGTRRSRGSKKGGSSKSPLSSN